MIEQSATHSPRTLDVLARRNQRWPWAFPPALEAAYALARRRQGRGLRVLLLCLPALAVWALAEPSLSVLPGSLFATPDWVTALTVMGVATPLLAALLVACVTRLETRYVRWAQVLAVLAVAVWLLAVRHWIVSQGTADHMVLTWLATAWLLVSAFGAYRWSFLLPGIATTVALVLIQDLVFSSAAGGFMQREALLAVMLLLIAAGLSVHQDRTRRQLWLMEQMHRVQDRLDRLTCLPHRHEWSLRLARHWATARREHLPLTLALVDLVAFNAFNMRHGHGSGDRALAAVAERIKQMVADDDQCLMVARYADDQFAVLWRGLNAVEAEQRVTRLRTELRATSVLDVQQRSLAIRCRVVGEHRQDLTEGTPDELENATRLALARDKLKPDVPAPRLVPLALTA